jgi:hypothetical protein
MLLNKNDPKECHRAKWTGQAAAYFSYGYIHASNDFTDPTLDIL